MSAASATTLELADRDVQAQMLGEEMFALATFNELGPRIACPEHQHFHLKLRTVLVTDPVVLMLGSSGSAVSQ